MVTVAVIATAMVMVKVKGKVSNRVVDSGDYDHMTLTLALTPTLALTLALILHLAQTSDEAMWRAAIEKPADAGDDDEGRERERTVVKKMGHIK